MNQDILNKINSDPYANFLGIKILEVKDGFAEASLKISDSMLNFHGTANGGVIFSLADVVFAAASNSYGQTAVGITVTIHYMAPGLSGETLTAVAKEDTKSSKLGLYRMEVKNEAGDLVTLCEGMVYRKKDVLV